MSCVLCKHLARYIQTLYVGRGLVHPHRQIVLFQIPATSFV